MRKGKAQGVLIAYQVDDYAQRRATRGLAEAPNPRCSRRWRCGDMV
jgi:hypothetical protein